MATVGFSNHGICAILFVSESKEEPAVRFHKTKEPKYDPARETPAIRQSICTGEKTAGFCDIATGRFSEIMLIRTQKDLDDFRKEYGVEGPIRTIY